jgi:hypothetical protein
MKHELSTFLSGCAVSCEFFYFAKELDEVAQAGSPNSTFYRYKDADTQSALRRFDATVSWPAIAMATSKPADSIRVVIAIGPNADYWELEPLSTQERVGQIADFKGNLRNLAVIADAIYSCGMGRAVLLRKAPGQWQSIGPKAMKGDPAVIGFEDIGGYDENEMYAAGWGGEIWWRDEGKWRRIDSPTSVNLRALCCTDDGVYIVGQNGTLLRGRHEAWDVLASGRKENLMDVAAYDGQIYVCTDFRILKLKGEKLVNDTSFAQKTDLPATCLYLLQAADGLISLGQKDVFRRKDGPWERII